MGNNHFGQLGHELADSTSSVAAEPQLVASLDGTAIAEIAAGSQYSLALAADGKLFAWGRGDCGQLGLGLQAVNPTPRVANKRLPDPVAYFRCGSNMTFVVTTKGSLFCTGDNSQGGLGMGDRAIVRELSLNNFIGANLRDVQPGESHTLFLKEDGQLLVAGSNANNQLGCPGILFAKTPVPCEYFRSANVSLVAAGNFSACVVAGRDVFLWGFGKTEESPLRLSVSGSDLVDLKVNGHTCVAVDEERKLWTFALHGRKTIAVKTGSVEGRAVACFGVGRGFWIGVTKVSRFLEKTKLKSRESPSKSIYRFESDCSSVESNNQKKLPINRLRVLARPEAGAKGDKRRESKSEAVVNRKSNTNDRHQSAMIGEHDMEGLDSKFAHRHRMPTADIHKRESFKDNRFNKKETKSKITTETNQPKPLKNTTPKTSYETKANRSRIVQPDKSTIPKRRNSKELRKSTQHKDKKADQQVKPATTTSQRRSSIANDSQSRSASLSNHRSQTASRSRPHSAYGQRPSVSKISTVDNQLQLEKDKPQKKVKKENKHEKEKSSKPKDLHVSKREDHIRNSRISEDDRKRAKVSEVAQRRSFAGSPIKQISFVEHQGRIDSSNRGHRSAKNESSEAGKQWPLKPPSADSSQSEEDYQAHSSRRDRQSMQESRRDRPEENRHQQRVSFRDEDRSRSERESPAFGRRSYSPPNSNVRIGKALEEYYGDEGSRSSSRQVFRDSREWQSASSDRRSQKRSRDRTYDLYIDPELAGPSKDSMQASKGEMQEAIYSIPAVRRRLAADVSTLNKQTSYDHSRYRREFAGSPLATSDFRQPLTSSNFQIYEQQPSRRQTDKAADNGRGWGRHIESEDKLIQTDSPGERSAPLTFQQLQSHQVASRRDSPIKENSESNTSISSTVRLVLEGWEQERQKLVSILEELDQAKQEISNLRQEVNESQNREAKMISTLKKLETLVDEKDLAEHALQSELTDRENLIDQLTEKVQMNSKQIAEAKEKEHYLKEEIQYLRSMWNKKPTDPLSRGNFSSDSDIPHEEREFGRLRANYGSQGHSISVDSQLQESQRDEINRPYDYKLHSKDYRVRDADIDPESHRALSFGDRNRMREADNSLIAVDNAALDREEPRNIGYKPLKDVAVKPATLVGSGSLSYTNSLYPPFKHDSKPQSLIDWDIENGSSKIYGYVDTLKHRQTLDELVHQKENLGVHRRMSQAEKKGSNSKLYCEFAKTALNLMSVFEEGDGLAKGKTAYLPTLPSELEDKVKDIKSKYCCTQP